MVGARKEEGELSKPKELEHSDSSPLYGEGYTFPGSMYSFNKSYLLVFIYVPGTGLGFGNSMMTKTKISALMDLTVLVRNRQRDNK